MKNIVKLGKMEKAVLEVISENQELNKTPTVCRAIRTLLEKHLLMKEDNKLFVTTKIDKIAITEKEKNKIRLKRTINYKISKNYHISSNMLYATKKNFKWLGEKQKDLQALINEDNNHLLKIFRLKRIMLESQQLYSNHEEALEYFFNKIKTIIDEY